MRIQGSKHFRALRFLACTLILIVVFFATPADRVLASSAGAPEGPGLKPILDYISSAWDTLTRSLTNCETLVDPKLKASPVLYLPAGFAEPPAVQKLAADCNVLVEHLPFKIHRLGEIDTSKIAPHGLLYLENKYVVPGGRFNEMYGWDSYFIVRGLLRAGRVELARGMVDNFFFEIEHYGAMLNANRTYYLTRSQPPFLSSMFVDIYRANIRETSRTSRGSIAPTPISTKITRCGRTIRTLPVRPDSPDTTISATAHRRRRCRTKPVSTARSRNISFCIPPRPATMSSRTNRADVK